MAILRKRLGDLLVEAGVITEQQLQEVLIEQRTSGMKLGDLLIQKGYMTEQQKIEALEFQLGIPQVQLHHQKIDEKLIQQIPPELAKRHSVLPLYVKDGKLVLAMADPLDYYAIDDLRLLTGFQISPVIATNQELNQMINRYYGVRETVAEVLRELPTELDSDTIQAEDSPVVRLVEQILHSAVEQRASDIHIEPMATILKVRFRVDGVLRIERELPVHMHSVITTRLKILANLNISERRLPQDGHFEMDILFKKIDIRISTLPTIHGEKVVLRILDVQNALKNLTELNMSQKHYEQFLQLISAPYGMILITGPTGSGKTTTLYSALSHLNSERVSIVTVEDPVEYQLEGINQIQVNPVTGMTFARGLRSILRQDPNIIMVGEIRDQETAEISIRSALTGHLLLSTLHTNNAVSALNRLIDMGIEPFLISSALTGIVAQRLVRKICPNCKEAYQPTPEEVIALNKYNVAALTLYKGRGCGTCNRTGYRGRMAVHEILPINSDLREMIVQRVSDAHYRAYLEEKGFTTMFQDGLEKVIAGETTLSELLRVTIE